MSPFWKTTVCIISGQRVPQFSAENLKHKKKGSNSTELNHINHTHAVEVTLYHSALQYCKKKAVQTLYPEIRSHLAGESANVSHISLKAFVTPRINCDALTTKNSRFNKLTLTSDNLMGCLEGTLLNHVVV